jgi:hypothetical protein
MEVLLDREPVHMAKHKCRTSWKENTFAWLSLKENTAT